MFIFYVICGESYLIPAMHLLLGNDVPIGNAISFWFYWHTMPLALAGMITILIW